MNPKVKRLDVAIDDAAQQLVSGDVTEELRSAVMEEITNGVRRNRIGVGWPRLAFTCAAVAAVAVIAVVCVIGLPHRGIETAEHSSPNSPSSTVRSIGGPRTEVLRSPETAHVGTPSIAASRESRRRQPSPSPAVPADQLAADDVTAIEPITIDAIGFGTVEIDQIAIAPVRVPEIRSLEFD